MNLLAFSDLHRDIATARTIVEASKHADIVIGAGDFATNGIGAREALDVLAQCVVPVLIVHGNHDDPDEVRSICDCANTLHHLHGGAITVKGCAFFGLGGEIPSRTDAPWNASETEAIAAQMLTASAGADVLISHTPPLGTADIQRNGAHEGSLAIRDATRQHQPTLLLCGHIHFSWGSYGTVGKTAVHNLGPTANWFSL